MKSTLPPDELPLPPHTGDGSKVFVSYARRDSHLVHPEIRRLQDEGFPIWYDWSDLPPGREWQAEIDKAVRTCSCFLVFVTPASVGSPHVRDEMEKALEAKRNFVCVYWRNLKLPAEIDGRVADVQAVHRYALHNSEYEARLRLALAESAGEPHKPDEPHVTPDDDRAAPHEARPILSNPWFYVCCSVLALCALFALLGLSVIATFVSRTPEPTDPPLFNLAAVIVTLFLFGLAAVTLGVAFAVYWKQLRGRSR